MSADRTVLGQKVRDLDESPEYQPISRVRILAGNDADGNQIVYEAGTTSGRTIDVENRLIRSPSQGQMVAQNILAAIQGYAYKPFSAAGAILDPAMEIGDGVFVDEVYSVLADIETTFSPLMTANIAAPEGSNIDHEYPYESSENRALIQEMTRMRTSFIVENGRIAGEISDLQQTELGLQNSITTLEMTVSGIHAYTDQEIQTISGGVVQNWAEINFTPTVIASKVSNSFDEKGAAAAALANSQSYTDDKIDPIEGQYTAAIEQSAKSIKATVAASETKYSIPPGITIATFGFGMPTADTAAQYNGRYYLDQSSGYYYLSNGRSWVRQNNTPLSLITDNLSSAITQTADSIRFEVRDSYQTKSDASYDYDTLYSYIEQRADSIKMQVSSYNGYTTFQLTDRGVVIDSETVAMTVDALNITGTIYADAVAAYASINSPTIYGGNVYGGKFMDGNGAASLSIYSDTVGNMTYGNLFFGSASAYPASYNAYFYVSGFGSSYTPYATMYLGGRQIGYTQDGTGGFVATGTWDFRGATVLLP